MTADGTPLLPETLRAYPFSWNYGFIWSDDAEETAENVAYARAVLETCLPPARLASPEPPEEPYVSDWDEYPEWTGIRAAFRRHMTHARELTREVMADVEADCAGEGVDTTDFEEIWVRRITAWLAEETLKWSGFSDDEAAFTPWLMELAEQFAVRGMAAKQAVWALRCMKRVPESRAALLRLGAVEGLPDEVRQLIESGIEELGS